MKKGIMIKSIYLDRRGVVDGVPFNLEFISSIG